MNSILVLSRSNHNEGGKKFFFLAARKLRDRAFPWSAQEKGEGSTRVYGWVSEAFGPSENPSGSEG